MSDQSPVTLAWDELREASILGSSRAQKIPDLESTLGIPLDPPDLAPDAALLQQLSMLAAMMRSSRFTPNSDDSAVKTAIACPPETRPKVNKNALFLLQTMMEPRSYGGLISEWLKKCELAGKIVPPEILPELLSKADYYGYRDSLCAVMGARGFWLAARHPKWSEILRRGLEKRYIDAPDGLFVGEKTDQELDEIWLHGKNAERHYLIRGLVKINPAKAVELLQKTWTKEKANEKSTFLYMFSGTQSPEIEPFFESNLDDPDKDVNRAASRVLKQIPSCAYYQRCLTRAKQLIRLNKPLIGNLKLEVSAPSENDPIMLRDGVGNGHCSMPKITPTEHMVYDICSSVRPVFWLTELNLQVTPEQFIRAVHGSNFRDPILEGLKAASVTYKDGTLAPFLLNNDKLDIQSGRELTDLIALLPAPIKAKVEADLPGRFPPHITGVRDAVLTGPTTSDDDSNRSMALGRAAIERLKYLAAQADPQGTALSGYPKEYVTVISDCIPLQLVDDVMTGWPEKAPNWNKWKPVIEVLQDRMRFRVDMTQEILAP